MALKAVNLDIVLFLGAGASQFAGYHTFQLFGKLITDPVVRLLEKLPMQSEVTPRLIESLNQALGNMNRPSTHDNYLWLLNDYYTFCGKFDTHSGLQDQFPRIRDEIHAFESSIITVINDLTRTTYCHYSRQRELGLAGKEVRLLYEELALSNSKTEPFLPVFTTNYDLLLEDMFNDKSNSTNFISLINGIPGRSRKGAKWNSELYKKNGINLYRLHGCVSWFRPSEQHLHNSVVFNRPASLDEDMLDRLCVMFPGHELEIGKDPHGYAFKYFYTSLLHCKRIVFIGFSFRDDDVMHLLLAANAAREEPLQIIIIDANIGQDEARENLSGARQRSKFLAAVPEADKIQCLRIEFGEIGCKQKVLDFLNEK
jgi:SIR2-like domain